MVAVIFGWFATAVFISAVSGRQRKRAADHTRHLSIHSTIGAISGIGDVIAADAKAVTNLPKVLSGAEVLVKNGCAALVGCQVGILTNPTAVTSDLQHIVDVLRAQPAVRVKCVFGPEHGFRGSAQDGKSEGSREDPRTGLPVYDLYRVRGEKICDVFRKSGIDTFVFDIQDVGARFYTFVWLMYDCMLAAAKLGIKVMVLDRPNPVGGVMVEGPVLQRGFESDLGCKPVAMRHGMTVGELASLFNGEFIREDAGKACTLEVVKMEGWARHMLFGETGLPWVAPSPNMPTTATALVYSGMGLFEGTNCSEGRGTTFPFEVMGAPWIDSRLAQAAQQAAQNGTVRGVGFREMYYQPTFSKFQGQTIGGVYVHVLDPKQFRAVRTALVLLVALKKIYGEQFQWRPPSGNRYFEDLLTGSDTLRRAVDSHASVDEIEALWQAELEVFKFRRSRYMLY